MRPITLAEQSAMMSEAGHTTWLRVRLRVGAVDVDLSDVRGHDWLLDANWTASLDAPVGTATVTLRRFVGPDESLTISPQVVSSPVNADGVLYEPLLREGRQLRIDVMTVPLGTGKVGNWRESFYGRIEDVSVDGEVITLSCRDWAGILQDIQIKEEHAYGNDTVGVAVQEVMNQILGSEGQWDFGPYCPIDPMWQLGRYKQEKMPLMDALQDLAGQLGWDLRLRWRSDVHGYAFTLAEPERTTNTPVWFFGPETYEDLDSLVRRLTDIRNSVRIVYPDANDRDPAGNPKRKAITEVNSASIAVYGERWSEIVEASTSNINTEAEARRLAQAFISDMSESALEITVTVPLWWHLELGDLVRLLPDGINFDQPQDLAVQSVEHSASADKGAATKLVLRGRPSTSRVAWLKREAIPGVGKAAPFTGPDAPGSLSVTNTVNGSSVSFTPAASGPAWDSFELHLSTVSGFTPSSSTFRGVSSTTRVDVTGLLPGTTYYARVRGRDAKGNVGTASAEVALAPRFVEPRFLQPYIAPSLVLNPDFEAHNAPSLPPDGWASLSGAWGVDQEVEAANVRSGARSLLVRSGQVGSQPFSAVEGNDYLLEVTILGGASGPPADLIVFAVDWYASIGSAAISRSQSTVGPQGAWRAHSLRATAPAGTKYGQVVLGKYATTNAPVYFDTVRMERFIQDETLNTTSLLNSWVPGAGFGFYKSQGRRVYLSGSISRAGAPAVGSTIFNLFAGYAPPTATSPRFVVPTDTGTATIEVTSAGAVVYRAGSLGTMWLDGVSFRVA